MGSWLAKEVCSLLEIKKKKMPCRIILGGILPAHSGMESALKRSKPVDEMTCDEFKKYMLKWGSDSLEKHYDQFEEICKQDMRFMDGYLEGLNLLSSQIE